MGGKFPFRKPASHASLGIPTRSISAAGRFTQTRRFRSRLLTKSAMSSLRAKRRFLGRREPTGALCAWGARVTARRWTSRFTRARSVGIASTGKRIESRAEGPRDGPKGARWMALSDRGHQSPGTALCNRAVSSARIAIRTMTDYGRGAGALSAVLSAALQADPAASPSYDAQSHAS